MGGRFGGARDGRWARLDDGKLLSWRICELGLSIDQTTIPSLVQQLYSELEDAGLSRFRPHVYLGDEWFSPEGVTAIAVPFYLAHPRLCELERLLMNRVEGSTRAAKMRLFRHEAGHCFDHAYKISRRREFRALFGSPARRYDPDAYRPDPDSRDFVQHLPGYYAQAHPDEDFAETFAVCITPDLDWRRRYRGWPKALQKLEFAAALIERFADTDPMVSSGPRISDATRLRSTLGRYYRKRLAEREAARERVKRLAPVRAEFA